MRRLKNQSFKKHEVVFAMVDSLAKPPKSHGIHNPGLKAGVNSWARCQLALALISRTIMNGIIILISGFPQIGKEAWQLNPHIIRLI